MDEVDAFREHVADTVGYAIGPDQGLNKFARGAGMCPRVLRNAMSGEHNLQIDTLAKVALYAGYRVKLKLEPILKKDAYSYQFEIPGLPHCNAAKRMHWRNIVEEKNKWIKHVHNVTVGHRPLSPLERARVTFTRHSTREPDSDNLRYSFKYIRDALTSNHCNIIVDDDPLHLEAEYRWEKARIKKSKISVLIEEI